TISAADIAASVSALADFNAYETLHHLTDDALKRIGDLDGDGKVTNEDLQGLLNLLADASGGGALSAVPEPAAWLLGTIAGLAVLSRFRLDALTRGLISRRRKEAKRL